MRHWLPLYEGDGYLHYPGVQRKVAHPPDRASVLHEDSVSPDDAVRDRGRNLDAGTAGDPDANSVLDSDPSDLQKQARALRAETLRAWFPKAAAWARDKLRYARMCEAERYLSQATDLADLERRLEQVNRGEICFNRD
jgi:hypothetical protein